jgi:hypothetical protein
MRTPRVFLTLIFAAIFCAVLPLSAAAQVGITSAFDLGIEVENFTYEEGDFMSEEGVQYGVYGAYTGYLMENIMAHVYGSYVGGDIDYDGGLQNVVTGANIPTTGTTPNSIFNFRLAGGFRFAMGGADLIPYAGFGYRSLENEITDEATIKATGQTLIAPCAGYQRDQTYSYIPVGVQLAFGSEWGVEIVGEYDYFLSGENHSYRTECGRDNTYEQDGGSGYRASVRIISPPAIGSMRVTIEPFFESWDIDKSNEVRNAVGDLVFVSWEPANTSETYGLRIGGRF